MVEAIVLAVDLEQKRISLSIKALEKKNNPEPEVKAEAERAPRAPKAPANDEDNWRNYTKIEDAPDAEDEEDENPFKALKKKFNS